MTAVYYNSCQLQWLFITVIIFCGNYVIYCKKQVIHYNSHLIRPSSITIVRLAIVTVRSFTATTIYLNGSLLWRLFTTPVRLSIATIRSYTPMVKSFTDLFLYFDVHLMSWSITTTAIYNEAQVIWLSMFIFYTRNKLLPLLFPKS